MAPRHDYLMETTGPYHAPFNHVERGEGMVTTSGHPGQLADVAHHQDKKQSGGDGGSGSGPTQTQWLVIGALGLAWLFVRSR
jgi:hypothetical protein